MSLVAFSFTKITVSDLAAAEAFYRDVIGLKVVAHSTAPDGEWAQEECIMSVSGSNDGPMLLLIRLLNKPAPTPGEAWTGFIIGDIAGCAAAVTAAGGTVLIEPHHVPDHGLWASVVTDPEGHMIELVQMGA